MTWKLMDRVLKDPHLRPGPRIVLMVLASYHNGTTGQCYPGMRTIMREAGMSERTLLRAIAVLRSGKYIEVKKGRSRLRTNLYALHPERWPAPTKTTRHNEQSKAAISDGSDLPTGQHKQGEESEKKNQEGKTCEKSQADYKNKKQDKAGKEEKNGKKENGKESKNGEQENIAPSVPLLPEKLEQLPPAPKGKSKLSLLWTEHTAALGVSACLTAKDGKMLRQAADKIGYANDLALV